jgi:hypothetical protein
MCRRESSWPYQDPNSNLSVVQPVASRYTNYTILAPKLHPSLTLWPSSKACWADFFYFSRRPSSRLCLCLWSCMARGLFRQCSFCHIHRECYRCTVPSVADLFLARFLCELLKSVFSFEDRPNVLYIYIYDSLYIWRLGNKKSAHMAWLTNLISQSRVDISPIWTRLINNEPTNSQRRSVWCDRFL